MLWLTESIKKYNDPVRVLINIIPIMENFVLGRVVMYFESPATLLILDIIFYPTLFSIKCSYKNWSKQIY